MRVAGGKGQSNAQTLFQVEQTPSDNHIRDMLDPVEPQTIYPVLPTRQTFFDDIRALMRYHCFPSWTAMMDFMMRGLEIGPYATQEA